MTMSENPFDDQGRIGIQIEETELSIAPAGNTTIDIALRNLGLEADTFALTVRGISASWISTATPTVTLEPGEEKKITLIIQAPPLPESNVGQHPIKIRATSKKVPSQYTEIDLTLTVATLEVQGRIGLLMDSLRFTVAPGSSTTFSIVLINHGLAEDTFRMKIDGIPMGWVSTSSPVTTLDAGEQRDIPITIQPPRAPESRAGRHTFTIEIVSKSAPDQTAQADCTLTIAAFSKFSSELQPTRMEAVQNGQLTVANEGNVRETFAISWRSHEDQLAFEVGAYENDAWVFTETKLHELRVPEGKAVNTIFRAGLRQRPIIGGKVAYPYSANLRSSGGETQTHNGEVVDQALIPIWVLPVVLVLCILMICITIFFLNWQNNQNTSITETAMAETSIAIAAATTVSAQETQSAQLTAGVPTDTPVPTETFTPTDEPTETPEPTFTETPTETFTPEPTETELPTDVPTEEPPPPTEEATVEATAEVTVEPTDEPEPPDASGEIIFESNRSGTPALYKLAAWNFTAEIIPGTEGATQPKWSPDGGRIVVSKDGDILTMNPDGSNIINLTNSPDFTEKDPAWAPDGQNIVYASNQEGQWQIYRIPAGGGDVTKLTDTGDNTQPCWFRSGGLLSGSEWIAFTSNRDENPEVYLMKNDGSDPRNLTNQPDNDSQPVGSPDGKTVLFTSDRDGNQEIYRVGEDGSGLVNLTNNPANDSLAVWARNGDWIAFTTNRDGNSEVYMMASDGTNPYNATRDPAEDFSYSWH